MAMLWFIALDGWSLFPRRFHRYVQHEHHRVPKWVEPCPFTWSCHQFPAIQYCHRVRQSFFRVCGNIIRSSLMLWLQDYGIILDWLWLRLVSGHTSPYCVVPNSSSLYTALKAMHHGVFHSVSSWHQALSCKCTYASGLPCALTNNNDEGSLAALFYPIHHVGFAARVDMMKHCKR